MGELTPLQVQQSLQLQAHKDRDMDKLVLGKSNMHRPLPNTSQIVLDNYRGTNLPHAKHLDALDETDEYAEGLVPIEKMLNWATQSN